MKNSYSFAKAIAVIVIIVAAIMISLGIFGVFSGSEIKDSLQKVVGLGAVVIVASLLITTITSRK